METSQTLDVQEDSEAHLDHVRLVAHPADLRHVPHLLLDQRGLEGHQHEEGEDAVVPVLVQTPQAHTEHLGGHTTRLLTC